MLIFPSGLSAATDAAYYQILLKLGVIRAPTYGERWDVWKATHSVPTVSHKRPRVSNPRTAEVRARVPFLASASSDLDEGFVEGETYDQNEKSLVRQARPSPRRELSKGEQSRSMVGYTPSQSIDYDVVTFNPPMRTSTPVYVQEQGYGRSTPPLPPYSVSDVSVTLDQTDSQLVEGLQTPPAVRAGWSAGKDELADAMVRELERRADEFCRTGLTGTCWDVWYRAERWIQVGLL